MTDAPQSTPLERYSTAMQRLNDNFADGRLGDEWVSTIEAAVAAERERCARRVEQFFAPCSGRIERAYGINLAACIREGR